MNLLTRFKKKKAMSVKTNKKKCKNTYDRKCKKGGCNNIKKCIDRNCHCNNSETILEKNVNLIIGVAGVFLHLTKLTISR